MKETKPTWYFASDPPKAAANLRKHGITFEEAMTVFEGDPSAYTDFDPEHSEDEERFFTIGVSSSGKLLRISHNEEGSLIRLINARFATNTERRLYEESEED